MSSGDRRSLIRALTQLELYPPQVGGNQEFMTGLDGGGIIGGVFPLPPPNPKDGTYDIFSEYAFDFDIVPDIDSATMTFTMFTVFGAPGQLFDVRLKDATDDRVLIDAQALTTTDSPGTQHSISATLSPPPKGLKLIQLQLRVNPGSAPVTTIQIFPATITFKQ